MSAPNTTVYHAAVESIGSVNPFVRRMTTLLDAAGRTMASVHPLGCRTMFGYDNVNTDIHISKWPSKSLQFT